MSFTQKEQVLNGWLPCIYFSKSSPLVVSLCNKKNFLKFGALRTAPGCQVYITPTVLQSSAVLSTGSSQAEADKH